MSAGATGRRRRVGLAGVLLIAILVLALALRLKGVAYGLPYSFVNSDESTVVPKAFHAAQGHLNPRFFFYPSLYFYLTGALYVLAAPVWWLLGHGNFLSQTVVRGRPRAVLPARPAALGGHGDGLRVSRLPAGPRRLRPRGRPARGALPRGRAAARRVLAHGGDRRDGRRLLAARAGPAPAGGRTAAEGRPSRRIAEEAAADAGEAAARLARRAAAGLAAERRAARRLVLGAVAAGLATSTKYNLGMLVLPATVAAVYACRGEVARRAAAGGRAALVWLRVLVLRVYVPMAVAFVVGVAVHRARRAATSSSDFRRQSQIMDRGWLGLRARRQRASGTTSPPTSTGAVGVVLVVLGGRRGGLGAVAPTRLDLLLAPYVVVYFVYIGTWKELADRYLLPIVPLLILLAVRLCVDARAAAGRGRDASPCPRSSSCFAVALRTHPWPSPWPSTATWAAGTRARSRAEWIQQHIPAGLAHRRRRTTARRWCARTQLAHYRAAGLDPVAYRVVRLKLPAPGTPDRTHDLARAAPSGRAVRGHQQSSARPGDAAPDVPHDRRLLPGSSTAKAELVKEFRPWTPTSAGRSCASTG